MTADEAIGTLKALDKGLLALLSCAMCFLALMGAETFSRFLFPQSIPVPEWLNGVAAIVLGFYTGLKL